MKIVVSFILFLSSLLAFSNDCGISDYKKFEEFSQLKKVVKDCEIQSVEDLIKKLPTELKKRRSLVYKSRGLGFASPEFPRVIYHGWNSSLTITHGTNKDADSFNTVEIAEYNKEKKDFDFRFIQFSDSGNETHFSHTNPRKCMACHHNKKMNKNQLFWGITPFWNGMYGSIPDKHWWLEPLPTPGVELPYFNGEKVAYEKFIAPNIGKEGSSILGLLPQSIHSVESNNWFRTGLKPYYTMAQLHAMTYMDSFKQSLNKQGVALEKAKYYLLYANNCIKEPEFKEKYTDQQIFGFHKPFVSEESFKKMLSKIATKHNFNSEKPNEILVSLREFIRGKVKQNYEGELKKNCNDQNNLYYVSGSDKTLECSKLFDKPFEEHSEFGDIYKNSEFFSDHTETHFMYLYIMFNYFDFPFEYVSSMDRLVFNGFGANHDLGADIQYPIVKNFNFEETDKDIYDFIVENALEPPYPNRDFPSLIFDEVPIANGKKVEEYFEKTACKVLAEKSLLHTDF